MPGMRTSLTMQPELDGSAPRQQLLGPGIGADRVAGVFEQLREGFPHRLVVFHDMDDTLLAKNRCLHDRNGSKGLWGTSLPISRAAR